MPTATPVILHLTDLHFGWDMKDIDAQNLRAVSQRTLLNTLAQLPAEWQPTVVCLSGDIGWHGIKSDYEAVKLWLDELLGRCGLDYTRVVVSAGNHDIIREVADYVSRPSTPEDADRALRLPLGEPHRAAFAHFTHFCEQVGIPAMNLHGESSWLVGERMVDDIRFVTVNSSWFCRDNYDQNKLWVGLPQLRDLENRGQLGRIKDLTTPLTVTLVHHPPEWWNENEIHRYNSRPNTRDFLAARSHLVLTGHTHAHAAKPDRFAHEAYHFPGAAAYAGGSHPNGFRLIRLGERFDYRSYQYEAGEDNDTWRLAMQDSVERQYTSEQPAELGDTQKKKPTQ